MERDIAQFGSALEWGSRGLGFESRYSDHLFYSVKKRLSKNLKI